LYEINVIFVILWKRNKKRDLQSCIRWRSIQTSTRRSLLWNIMGFMVCDYK